MITLESHKVRVPVIRERDIDRQSENLQKVRGYIDLDFQRGWWGDPDYFIVEFEAKGFNLARTIEACEKAINRARKVKSNDDCECYLDDMRRTYKRMDDYARAHPMRIYYAKA